MPTLLALSAFSGALALSLVLTPLFRLAALKLRAIDQPAHNHKRHHDQVPLLGGLAIFCSLAIVLIAGIVLIKSRFLPLGDEALVESMANGMAISSVRITFVFLGAVLALLLGLLDDLFPLSAAVKFAGQLLIAIIAVYGGMIKIDMFAGIPFLSAPATVFWIMLLMNSINFFDNMDGLAAGTCAIALFFFAVVSILSGQFFVAALSGATCGAVCGFWYYNTDPARIFMGDSGSHFLGYMLAVISVGTTFYHSDGANSFSLSLLMPLLILALPLFDTAMVVIIRFYQHKPFWIGDRNHISHRFVRMGLSRPQAVRLVHLLALCIALGSLPLYWGGTITAVVLIIQNVVLLTAVSLLQFTLSKTDK